MAGFHLDDTIAAVSTAMAPAGIGIVRISGNDAFEVADRVFRAKKEGKKLSAVKSHTIHYGWITEGDGLSHCPGTRRMLHGLRL